MAPKILEGNNLGQRHRHYNTLLKTALASNQGETLGKVSHDDNDIDNFLKIDIASHNRDVNYILEVLKCKDLLYVTRVIKKSRWLITDDKYSHIVNPKYLHTELFPHMMQKLHLRDEKRVKQFYNYFKQLDRRSATKWLQYCPLQFALNEVRDHAVDVSESTLKRLCRRTVQFLEKYAVSSEVFEWDKEDHLQKVNFLIRHNTEEYLNVRDSCSRSYTQHLKDKHLKIIMKTCPQRIIKNFYHYFYTVKYSNLVKYMDKESIKHFLLECSEGLSLSIFGRDFDFLIHFLIKIEYSDKIEVLKAFYETTSGVDYEGPDGLNLFFSAMQDNAPFNSLCVFRWYQCMPFDVAFYEVKKLLQNELESDVRMSMLNTLVICAGSNIENTYVLLKYFNDRHINEPHKVKKSFVYEILSRFAIYKFDSETWKILDDIFFSMEVYMDSSLSVTKCVEAIIVYKTIHDQIVPEKVENKFKFETLKSYKNKLNAIDSEKLFQYLYKIQATKVKEATALTKKEFTDCVKILENTMKLLADWNKNIINYPMLLSKIQDIINIKEKQNWDIDLSSIYNIHKPWREYFFVESLMLYPSKLTLLNVLKHNQSILKMYHKEVDFIRYNDIIQLVLSKLKIYWSDTLAKEWTNDYLSQLHESGKQKNAIHNVAVLLNQKDFLNISKQYIPQESKINWQEADEVEYYCRKYFARNIYRVRPPPATDTVLLFAKGIHRKLSVISYVTTLENISNFDLEEHMSKLISVPLFLQKHGIRIAFAKLTVENLIPTFETIWKSTKSHSIQTYLFLNTYNLLCKQSRKSRILKQWKMLQIFIDNLSISVNPKIYEKMCHVSKVPEIIQSEYFMKAYVYFKTLPRNLAVKYTDDIIVESEKTVIFLDEKFMEEVELGSIDEFPNESGQLIRLFARYLLLITDKKTVLDIYQRRVKPVLYKKDCYSIENSKELIDNIFRNLLDHVTRNRTIPLTLFNRMFDDFKEKLSFPEDYVSIRTWELTCDLMEILERNISTNVLKKSEGIDGILNTNVLSAFGKACLKHLQKDIKSLAFPIPAFECVMRTLHLKLDFSLKHMLQIYKHMLGDQSTVESYFIVEKLLPEQCLWDDDIINLKKEIIEILCTHPSKEFRIICRRYFHHHNKQDVKLKCGELLA
ncbi:hypothetical protein ABMA27_009923 [Loxostege sticticalis]|uniref:Uncharacterized protein n=1 Tax=Loxostege sticticalis TaxID=481309 RepID=A0ABR3H6W7_LOXSC